MLLFNNQFWGKLINTPTTNDKAGYWLNRLFQKVQSAQKEAARPLNKFITELGEKFGEKNDKGVVIMNMNGLPQPKLSMRDEYDDMYEQFVSTQVEIKMHKLSLDLFSHLQKTPLDWEILEMVTDVTPEGLDTKNTPGMGKLSQVN